LRDVRGRAYLDANSSIWTNLHGHCHPKLNTAMQRQMRKVAHSSALGLANEPASLLAEKLVQAANPRIFDFRFPIFRPRDPWARKSQLASPKLTKVFYSDDGSTAMEVALKLAYACARRLGLSRKPKFLSLQHAYHGDTVGAASLGHIDLLHKAYAGLVFKSDSVMAPYCYRCPFNRARPERADARTYRRCEWECVGQVEQAFARQKRRHDPYVGFVFEPLMQGAAGMIPHPSGWLRQVVEIARGHGVWMIADEVMTGFGRAGQAQGQGRKGEGKNAGATPLPTLPLSRPLLFASHQEGVQPDFLALAKGLTGGMVPMAATLTTQAIFDSFLGEYEEFKTFFHGHSYTGNQMGAAAALASLEILQSVASIQARQKLQEALREGLHTLWSLPQVGDIRQVGLMAGVELVRDWRTRRPFDRRERVGGQVCEAMARRGVLTRPIGDVIVIMPPYCTNPRQVGQIIEALRQSVLEVCAAGSAG
jgi:adenosylmethionine-8-amino-7-oxononanoate aminotransferase